MDDRNKKGSFPGRAIVAPHLDEAQVLREESERALSMLNTEKDRQTAQDREKLPKAVAAFDRDEMAGMVRKLEASKSADPATLVKRGTSLSLEHPEARTTSSQPVADESVQNMREGYRLTKVQTAQLKQAVETTPEGRPVQMRLEADRVAGFGEAQTQPRKKAAAAARREDDLAI